MQLIRHEGSIIRLRSYLRPPDQPWRAPLEFKMAHCHKKIDYMAQESLTGLGRLLSGLLNYFTRLICTAGSRMKFHPIL